MSEQQRKEMTDEIKSEVVNTINVEMTQLIKNNIEKDLSGKIDEEKRRKNLIIFNISEPEDLEPGATEENDRTFCENMFVEKLNVDNVKIKKVIIKLRKWSSH